MNLKLWLHGLVGGFIGGGASAASTWLATAGAQAAGVDVPSLNWKSAGIVFLTSGIISACAYLKSSPLPDNPTTTPPTP